VLQTAQVRRLVLDRSCVPVRARVPDQRFPARGLPCPSDVVDRYSAHSQVNGRRHAMEDLVGAIFVYAYVVVVLAVVVFAMGRMFGGFHRHPH
jgi:hypothetical protein